MSDACVEDELGEPPTSSRSPDAATAGEEVLLASSPTTNGHSGGRSGATLGERATSTAVARDGGVDGTGARDGSPASLVAAVEGLHRQLEGLRASAALRAVIEQAKGMLVERHGISLEEAFDRLRRLSSQHNVRLVEVAATIVGVRLPDDVQDRDLDAPVPPPGLTTSAATSRVWATLRTQPDVQAKTATALFHAASTAVDDGADAARLVHALAAPLGVDGVVLYSVAVDGALQLVGHQGFPDEMISAWRRVPPDVDMPLTRAMRGRSGVYLASRSERNGAMPSTSGVDTGFEAVAGLPVVDGGEVIGVVGLGWKRPHELDAARRARLEHLVRTSAPVLIRTARQADPESSWLAVLLDMLFDPWLLLVPVNGPDGGIDDFEVEMADPALERSAAYRGRRLLELWPGLTTGGVFDHLVRVAVHGGMWDDELPADLLGRLPRAGSVSRIRAVRVGGRLVLHWRVCDE